MDGRPGGGLPVVRNRLVFPYTIRHPPVNTRVRFLDHAGLAPGLPASTTNEARRHRRGAGRGDVLDDDVVAPPGLGRDGAADVAALGVVELDARVLGQQRRSSPSAPALPLPPLEIDVPTNSVATTGVSALRSSTRRSLTQLEWMSPVSTTGLGTRRSARNWTSSHPLVRRSPATGPSSTGRLARRRRRSTMPIITCCASTFQVAGRREQRGLEPVRLLGAEQRVLRVEGGVVQVGARGRRWAGRCGTGGCRARGTSASRPNGTLR